MSIALMNKVNELERRIAALEQRLIDLASPAQAVSGQPSSSKTGQTLTLQETRKRA